MLLKQDIKPDSLVVCFSLFAFVLTFVVVREFTRKRKSPGKKRELQRPFIKRRSPSPRRTANVLPQISPANRQHGQRSPHFPRYNAKSQLSRNTIREDGSSVSFGILGQVMASISQPTLPDIGKLATAPPVSHTDDEIPHREKVDKLGSSSISLPADKKHHHTSRKETPVKETRPTVEPEAAVMEPVVTHKRPEGTGDVPLFVRRSDEHSRRTSDNLYKEEKKRASLLEPEALHQAEVCGKEMQLEKSNQAKLKELQLWDIKHPFRNWVHGCPVRKPRPEMSIWGHKCVKHCFLGSFLEKKKSDNESVQDRAVMRNGGIQSKHPGLFRRPRSFCDSGDSTTPDFKLSGSKIHSRQCRTHQEGDLDQHCNRHDCCSRQKPRSCDNLSPRNCAGVDCESELKTGSFHKCNEKVHNSHDHCKHNDMAYHCLNISVSPKRYYSLGSLCDVSICGRLHLDMSAEEDFERNESTGSRSSAECGSYNHDTGYTSTEEMDTLSTVKTNLDTGSYDGDSEYDSEEGSRLANILEFSDEMVVRPQLSISELYPIDEYAQLEWKGETATAQAIRKGYGLIPSHVGCYHLRQVRGDNYCAIRAALFQALVDGIPLLASYPSKQDVLKIPSKLACAGYACLEKWSFAGRVTVPQSEVLNTLEDFLHCLVATISEVAGCATREERLDIAFAAFNEESGEREFKLLEAVKLLMFNTAVDLHKAVASGCDVPVFAYLLFARDSSDTPEKLMRTHLNQVGDSGGLEQVEVCLLGQTLGAVIRVMRPSQVDQEDFVAYFPSLEDTSKNTPMLTLIAEDDRHYNIAA